MNANLGRIFWLRPRSGSKRTTGSHPRDGSKLSDYSQPFARMVRNSRQFQDYAPNRNVQLCGLRRYGNESGKSAILARGVIENRYVSERTKVRRSLAGTVCFKPSHRRNWSHDEELLRLGEIGEGEEMVAPLFAHACSRSQKTTLSGTTSQNESHSVNSESQISTSYLCTPPHSQFQFAAS